MVAFLAKNNKNFSSKNNVGTFILNLLFFFNCSELWFLQDTLQDHPYSSNTDKLSNQLSEGKQTKPVFYYFAKEFV